MSGIMCMMLGAFASEVIDPYFKNNILLLHGDGTNGAQNNTFLDSSSNNFTITRNGNTTQGSFSPFSKEDGKWGNYFDGTGDYLDVSNSSTCSNFGTGDFTVEGWFYFANMTAQQVLFDFRSTAFQDAGSLWWSSTDIAWYVQGSNRITGGSLSANTWYHIAVCRSGTSTKLFVNGTQVGSTFTDSYSYIGNTDRPRIGYLGDGTGSLPFTGYMSNLRVLKGTAQYTSNFTPPTTPLTAITNTSLLTCQSNRFKDNSSNAFAITPSGDAAVTPFSPFANSAAYSAATNGGSGYFDGTGDWVQTPADVDFQMGSGDFTIECWHYDTGTIDSYPGLVSCSNGWESGSVALRYNNLGNGKYGFYLNPSDPLFSSTNTFPKRCWNHVAVVRSGTTITMYVNGASEGSATSSATVDIDHTGGVRVGRGFDVSSCITGYVSSVRILKGTAQYTGAFTPATAPFTAITNTSLLLNFTNAGIYDNAAKCVVETVGNAQVSTTTKQFGTGSIAWDGTGDWCLIPYRPELELGSGDFTIEFWCYLSSTGRKGFFRGSATSDYSVGIDYNSVGTNKIGIWASSNGTSWNLINADGGGNGIGTTTVSQTTWTHIVFQRSGTTWSLYVNGNRDLNLTSISGAIATKASQPRVIGAWDSAGTYSPSGYIDEFRITKGVARYSGPTITVPTAAFPDR